jgi:DUF917 family protein
MSLGQEIGDAFIDGIVHPACGTMQSSFQNLFLILFGDREDEVAFADGTTENIH